MSRFLKLAKEIWGEEYDYSKFVYTFAREKGEIVCKKHGSFYKSLNKHTHKGSPQGCVKCSNERVSLSQSTPRQVMLDKFISVHGDKYSYELTDDVYRMKDKIEITCKHHGIFLQSCEAHSRGKSCPKCVGGVSKSYEDFLNSLSKKHIESFLYPDEKSFVNWSTKIEITCRYCDVKFEQKPTVHLSGKGCPNCNKTRGWSRSQWVEWCKRKGYDSISIYIVRLSSEDEVFYKFGISSNIEKRFKNSSRMPYNCEIVEKLETSDYKLSYDLENLIMQTVSPFSYKPFRKFSGETECFSEGGLIDALAIINHYKSFGF